MTWSHAGRHRRQLRRCGVGAAVAALCLIHSSALAGAQSKVLVTPAAVALTEGQSQVVQIRLTQPLLAPPPAAASLSFALNVTDPDRVSLSSPSVTWAAAEWAQSRNVTVTALQDGVHNSSDTVEITASASTAAPFYSGVTLRIVVTLQDLDPEPTTTVSTTTTSSPASTTTTSVTQPAATPSVGGLGVGPSRTSDAHSGTGADELALTGAPRSSAPLTALGAALLVAGLAMSWSARRGGRPAGGRTSVRSDRREIEREHRG